MSDIVERLRLQTDPLNPTERHALADEIERLQKQVIHWREARRSCIAAGDMMQAEIERLRQLLRDAGVPEWVINNEVIGDADI